MPWESPLGQVPHLEVQPRRRNHQIASPQDLADDRVLVDRDLKAREMEVPIPVHDQLDALGVQTEDRSGRRLAVHHHGRAVEVDGVEPDPCEIVEPGATRGPLRWLSTFPVVAPKVLLPLGLDYRFPSSYNSPKSRRA